MTAPDGRRPYLVGEDLSNRWAKRSDWRCSKGSNGFSADGMCCNFKAGLKRGWGRRADHKYHRPPSTAAHVVSATVIREYTCVCITIRNRIWSIILPFVSGVALSLVCGVVVPVSTEIVVWTRQGHKGSGAGPSWSSSSDWHAVPHLVPSPGTEPWSLGALEPNLEALSAHQSVLFPMPIFYFRAAKPCAISVISAHRPACDDPRLASQDYS